MDSFIKDLTAYTGTLAGYSWGIPTIIALIGTGLFLSIKLNLIQVRGFAHGVKVALGRYDSAEDSGQISHLKALTTALSGTVGTGNIAGVATAIAMGGPGAVFWMWITAIVGMASKFTSCSLAVKYREISSDGQAAGGPMYTLKNGLNLPKLGSLFAIVAMIAALGTSALVHPNSVADGFRKAFSISADHVDTLNVIVGIALAFLVGLVIIGGIKRIAQFSVIVVPFMAFSYILVSMIVIIANIEQFFQALQTIFSMALTPAAGIGGVFGEAMRYGVARGIYSNESGLGSAAIAHGAAKTNEPIREGLVAMLGPFIDTILICTMTAVIIIMSGSWGPDRPAGLEGSALTLQAYSIGFGSFGQIAGVFIGLALVFFAFTSLLAWYYYGERCFFYLFKGRASVIWKVIFISFIFLGAIVPLKLVWNIADIVQAFMIIPNLISLILLSKMIAKMSTEYMSRNK